jgi:hypothetical protein
VNIEEEFLSFEHQTHAFPHTKDYVGLYKEFKAAFDKQIHPEIKTKILEIEKDGYYNDHGIDHIKMVIDRVSKILTCVNATLIKSQEGFYISPYEVFILLLAIQLHDAGHLISSRDEHAKKGKELLAKFDAGNKLSTAEKMIIGNIARAHGGKNDPIGNLETSFHLSHERVRPQLLAALLRLGDELAEDETRASKFLLDIDNLEQTSVIYHLYSASLNSIELSGNEISLIFYVTDKYLIDTYPKKRAATIIQEYLINEIYSRAQKTFTESLYCSRFLPEESRFNKVKVKINLLTSLDQDEITEPIGFELKEHGYPTISNDDIYSLCEGLKRGSQKIDGEYISGIVKSKLQTV